MKDALYRQLREFQDLWHRGLSYEFLRSAIALFAVALLSFVVCLALPTLRESLLASVLASMESVGAVKEDGTLSAAALLSNNLHATLFIMLYGLIPLIRLPALALGMNGMVLGVVAAWYVTNQTSLALFFAAILPHGLFEFPALIVAFAIGLFVCNQLTRRLLDRDTEALGLGSCLICMCRVLLFVLLPLLGAAAVIEAYITPVICSLFF